MTTDRNTREAHDQGAPVAWGTFEAPGLGTLWLAWTDRGLMRLSYQLLDDLVADPTPTPSLYTGPLERYFRAEPEDFSGVPLDLRGTDFQLRVWGELREIPWGHVRTYGGIARRIRSPRAMRAVGQANHVNPIPIVVPCHRVVEAGHHLGGYGGGLERKRFLLEVEGVRIHEGVVQPGQLELF